MEDGIVISCFSCIAVLLDRHGPVKCIPLIGVAGVGS